MKQTQLEKEWSRMLKAEERFIQQNLHVKENVLQRKVQNLIPEKLQGTLDSAFYKVFGLIFEKGTGIIEKTYQKEKKEQNYKVNHFSAQLKQDRKSLKKFGKEAGASKNINLAVSTVEGVGMGLLGMGLPDIPVFLGVLLKSIYEIALSYGFSYDTPEEQRFILELMEAALSHEGELLEKNAQLNHEISGSHVQENSIESQMKQTAQALSKELLYLKFIQGIPVAGVIGGLSDMVYQKKITDYAMIKYQRRYLEKLMQGKAKL